MIYLVEDDTNIRELVLYTLHNTGLEAQGFGQPSAFWDAVSAGCPDLILLDIMLPQEDGLSILRRLRQRPDTEKVPVILLTAKDSEYDKVVGLETGADDYITKPFGMMELLARIKAQLRRAERHRTADSLGTGILTVCPQTHTVRVGGEEVVLTCKEFELLCLLLRRRGAVLTRDQMLNEVWGYGFDGESRTVDVHIRTLRQKLGDAGEYIETVRGIGYKIGGAHEG